MARRLKNNESGVILIMVLMTTVVVMILSIGLMSQGVSQTKSAEEQVARIRAEQLAIGAYAKTYTDLATGAAVTSPMAVTIDGKNYNVTVTDQGAIGPNGTSRLSIVSSTTPN